MLSEEIHTIWSTYIQRPETLYKTRKLRFRDENRQLFLEALDLKDGMNILDVGCGPGAYCYALERWLPNSQIIGLDRDSVFIKYAIEKSRELNSKCSFIIGDATNLEFPDNTFDATTSYTVIEHIETTKFLSEQYRILRAGGICTVLTVRSGLSINPERWEVRSEEEKALWDKVESYFQDSYQKYSIATYAIDESELPKRMMEAGFGDISINFLVQANIPDNADVNHDLARDMIEADRQVVLDSISVAQALACGVWSDTEVSKLKQLVNSTFDQRIAQYKNGRKIWDISASVLIVARGYK